MIKLGNKRRGQKFVACQIKDDGEKANQLDPRRRRQIPLRRVLVPDVGGADGEA